MSNSDQSDARKSVTPQLADQIVGWAVCASIVWVVTGVAYGLTYAIGKDAAWLVPNNFGDYLAGIFAPLAFGWLVVATFLQKFELQAQREQLAQNGKALELQAAELKASVEELQLQTQQMKSANIENARERFIARREKQAEMLTGDLWRALQGVYLFFYSGPSGFGAVSQEQLFSDDATAKLKEARDRQKPAEFLHILADECWRWQTAISHYSNVRIDFSSLGSAARSFDAACAAARAFTNFSPDNDAARSASSDQIIIALQTSAETALAKMEDALLSLRQLKGTNGARGQN